VAERRLESTETPMRSALSASLAVAYLSVMGFETSQ